MACAVLKFATCATECDEPIADGEKLPLPRAAHQLQELFELQHAVGVHVDVGDEVFERRLRRLDGQQVFEDHAKLIHVNGV